MPTQRPLRDLVPEIVTYIEAHKDNLEYNNRLTLIHDGQLYSEVIKSLKEEFRPETVAKLKHRIPCINILVRIIDKLSRVYVDSVKRFGDNLSDTQIVNFYEKAFDLDNTMGWANRLYNLHQYCALEPYLTDDGQPKVRVLSADNFLVWSDDPSDPTNPTVFIKFMGEADPANTFTDRKGNYKNLGRIDKVSIYYLYSDDEFLIVDSEGHTRSEFMSELGQQGLNPLGRLPFVYINMSKSRLIPLPDTDMLENTLLIPKLLGDLNYAVKYLSHSFVIARDLQLPDTIDRNPDAIWEVKSDGEDGVTGSIEVLKPEVDIDKVLTLIQSTLAIWLESKNLRPGTMGDATAQSRVPALAKIIDEADATAERKRQMGIFHKVEKELFDLLAAYHKLWRYVPEFPIKKVLSEDFEVRVVFPDQKPITTERLRIEEAQMLINAGLATRRQALKKIYPTMTDKELDAWIEELDGEQSSQAVVETAQFDGEEGDRTVNSGSFSQRSESDDSGEDSE